MPHIFFFSAAAVSPAYFFQAAEIAIERGVENLLWTNRCAGQAEDAFGRKYPHPILDICHDIDIHRAYPGTGSAPGASISVPRDLQKRKS